MDGLAALVRETLGANPYGGDLCLPLETQRSDEIVVLGRHGLGSGDQAAGTGLAEGGPVALAFCWAHVRRKFFEIQASTPAPIAAEALARIGAPHPIQRDIRGRAAPTRQAVRQAQAKPILDAMKPWLGAKLAAV